MPTSVRLDAETERAVERLARAKRSTKSRVIREAILAEAEREQRKVQGNSAYARIAHLIGVETGGPRNLSEKTGRRVARLLRQRERKSR
jgi:chemotaxis response regulator CheB